MSNSNNELYNSRSMNMEWENYFANTIIPQIFVDGSLVLRKFTPPAMKQFNLKPDDVGRPLRDIAHNFRFPSLIENIHYVLEHRSVLEKEIQTTDLSWYQMNILPYIRIQDDKLDGVIITFVDITTRIRDLQEQEKLVTENERLFDTLVHDIKAPLSVLAMTAAELKKNRNNDPALFEKLLGILDSTVAKTIHFIDDLADKRKQEFQTIIKSELLDLENILEDVLLSLRDKINRTNARITYDFEYSQVRFGKRELRSILFNLIQNSLRYRDPNRDPEIFIKSERKGLFTIISVRDNGIGIEKQNQDRIFKKYERVDDSKEGSGMGLFLVKQIMNLAGGKIDLKSEPGKGTEVVIQILTDTE